MAHITASVEYGIHCLLWLVGNEERPISCGALAELQGISPSFAAKILSKLEKAGILRSSEGLRGGYMLAREASEVSFLDIVDAIEGRKPIFQCTEIRRQCAIFGSAPPTWAAEGTCAVHAVMLQAENAMRAILAAHSLGDVSKRFVRKAPDEFQSVVNAWLEHKLKGDRGMAPTRNQVDPA